MIVEGGVEGRTVTNTKCSNDGRSEIATGTLHHLYVRRRKLTQLLPGGIHRESCHMIGVRRALIRQQAEDPRYHAMLMRRNLGSDRLVTQDQAELFPTPTYLHRVRTLQDCANCQETGNNLRRTKEDRQEACQRPKTRS